MHSSSGCAVTIKTLSFDLNGDARGLFHVFQHIKKGLSEQSPQSAFRIRTDSRKTLLRLIIVTTTMNIIAKSKIIFSSFFSME